MNLKVSPKTAVETAIQLPKSTVFKLCGIEQLNKINPDLAAPIDESHLFKNVFGTDVKLFYVAEKVSSENKFIIRERGIGYVSSKDGEYYFNRITPISLQFDDGKIEPCTNMCVDMLPAAGETVIISSCYPATYLELLHNDHCLITSCDPFVPASPQISKNSFVGRLQEDIRAISFSDFSDIEELQEALLDSISKYSKQIALSCSKFNLKKKNSSLSSYLLQLNPSSDPPAKRGTIFYDENDDKIKYYDGTSWRSLKIDENS